MSYKKLIPKLDMDRLPVHTGIIMDGNGRGQKRFLPRLQGHNAGAKSIRQVTELAVEIVEIPHLYAFPRKTGHGLQMRLEACLSC